VAGNIKVNGVWKNVSNYSVKVNGVWKTVTNGYVKVNGVWKQFLSPSTPTYYSAPVYYTAPNYYGGGGGVTYYTVTNVVGLTVSQATNSITGSGNLVGSTSSTSTTNSSLDGTVASQSPSSGLYAGQQTVSFTYYTYTATSGGTGGSVCGSGGSTTSTEFYCQGPQRWSRSVTTYYDANGTVCNTVYGAGFQEVSCSPNCNCGIYYAPTYYTAPVTYYTPPVVTYYAAPIYYTAPTYYSPPVVTYYAAPIYYTAPVYYNFNSTYFAAPTYYSPPVVTYYAAPIYYTAPVYYTTSGGGCWAYGTQVTLSDGSTKPIEDVVVGDVLRAPIIPTYPNGEDSSKWYPASVWSTETADALAYEDTVVTNTRHVIESSYYLLNDTFKVTGDHFVFVKKGTTWQFAQVDELSVGDLFKSETGEEVEITKKVEINESTMVVDIDVEDNDLFFANGIITHNFKL
jgi:hypothetical protein